MHESQSGKRWRGPVPGVLVAVVLALVFGAGQSWAATQAAEHPSGVLSVVVLGDSVPAGTACNCTPSGELAAAQLGAGQGRRVTVDNESVAGFDSSDVLAQLANPELRRRIAGAEGLIVEVGANDFDADQAYRAVCLTTSACFGDQLPRTSANLAKIITTARSLQTKSGAQVVALGYWNVFVDGAVGRDQGVTFMTVSNTLTREFDARLATVAESAGAVVVDVSTAFDRADAGDPTALLAADGDHPNARGH